MALSLELLKSDLRNAFQNAQTKTNKSEDPTEDLISAIANSIYNFVLSAEVQGAQYTVAAGIPTAGTPSAQITTAPGTVVGVGKLN